jgi:hypothetical protein
MADKSENTLRPRARSEGEAMPRAGNGGFEEAAAANTSSYGEAREMTQPSGMKRQHDVLLRDASRN